MTQNIQLTYVVSVSCPIISLET